jgi:hypothetical protein
MVLATTLTKVANRIVTLPQEIRGVVHNSRYTTSFCSDSRNLDMAFRLLEIGRLVALLVNDVVWA